MPAKIIAFGAYDTRKPRVRLLIEAIRRRGALAGEIVIRGWERVAQTNIPSRFAVLGVLLRFALGYPGALWRLIRSPKGASILLPYPGVVEIFLVAPLARCLCRPIILDAFLPLHDTIVNDRALVARGGIVERAIWKIEKTALGLADVVLVDTDAHGDYFASEFGIDRARFETVLVGAEDQFFRSADPGEAADFLGPADTRPIVLFYGQLIPLHGVPTIIEAARRSRGSGTRWVIVGRGQLEPLLREAVKGEGGDAIEWIEWVDYDRLPGLIARADLCLGVFGGSDKAARVIPNKLFQQLAVGRKVITRSSPAVDPLAREYPAWVRTIPTEDPQALAEAVAEELADRADNRPAPPAAMLARLSPDAGVERLLERLEAGG